MSENTLEIIPETPRQHAEQIEALYDATFGPGHFAKTAERLREGNASIADINRVAIQNGETVVGVCRVWPVTVGDGSVSCLFIGPVAVSDTHRGSRLGLTVTGEALEAASLAGWDAALIVGIPAYFGEIGFKVIEPGQLTLPGPVDYRRVMVRDLAKAGGGAELAGAAQV